LQRPGIRCLRLTELAALTTAEPLRELVRSNIFIIRELAAIDAIYHLILDSTEAEYGKEDRAVVASFLDHGTLPSEDCFTRFVTLVERLRDGRAFSSVFSSAIFQITSGIEPTLIDTGYLRIVLPSGPLHEQIRRRPELYQMRDRHDPEVMIMTGGALAHRDIQAPHFSTQMNFWFPLHDLEADGSLLLFPDVARQRVGSYLPVSGSPPEQWGYGRPLQVALQRGDALLFHSEQYHASPVAAGLRPRISMEIRVSLACPDDNAVYRRLFWDLKNFASQEMPIAPRFDEIVAGKWDGRTGESAASLYHRLFDKPLDARRASETLSTVDEIRRAVSLPAPEALDILDSLTALDDVGSDLAFFCAKTYFVFDRPEEAWVTLQRLAENTNSYFWVLECARLAAEAGNRALVEDFLSRAERLANGTTVTPEPVGEPDLTQPPFQLLPATCQRACAALRRALHASERPRLFDYRLFYPLIELVKSFPQFDVVKFHLLYVAIPVGRCIDPDALIGDPEGLAWGASLSDVVSQAFREISPRQIHADGSRGP
jgi:hypothetical protein